MRLSVKNTFLTVADDIPEEEFPRHGTVSPPSRHSASPRARSAEHASDRTDFAAIQQSLQIERLNRIVSPEGPRSRASFAPSGCQSPLSPAKGAFGAAGPTSSDMTMLQQKLAGLTAEENALGSPARMRPIRHVFSSASLSSLGSDFEMPDGDGSAEFDLVIEEEEQRKENGNDKQGAAIAVHQQEGSVNNTQRPSSTVEFKSVVEEQPTETRKGSVDTAATNARSALPKEYRHGHVPRTLNLAEEFSKQEREEPPTTLMIRNIPNRYTQRELILELEALGFQGAFDFLYIPLDKGTMSNVGYAFVNFLNPTLAKQCIDAFQNYRFKKHRKVSGKTAVVSVAHLQGLAANIKHYENAAINTSKLKQRRPVIIANISQTLSSALGLADASEN